MDNHSIDEEPFPQIDIFGGLMFRHDWHQAWFDASPSKAGSSEGWPLPDEHAKDRFGFWKVATISKGVFSKITVSISRRAWADGYCMSDCVYSRGRITGRIVAKTRPLEYAGLWCYLLDKRGRPTGAVLVEVPDLNPGESGEFAIAGKGMRKAKVAMIDLPQF